MHLYPLKCNDDVRVIMLTKRKKKQNIGKSTKNFVCIRITKLRSVILILLLILVSYILI